MAATYGSSVQVRAWSKTAYAPPKLYNIIPYRDGVEVSGDTETDIESLAEADDIFQRMMNAALRGEKDYDQVSVTERSVTVPS